MLILLLTVCGQLYAQPTGRVIRKQVAVHATAADVWAAWTTRDGLVTFMAADAKVSMTPGGPYEIYFNMAAPEGKRGSEGCTVVEFSEPRHLAFTWNAPPQFPEIRAQRTRVDLTFESAGDGSVVVTLVHSGWKTGAKWDEVYNYFDAAWGMVLGNLAKRFAAPPKADNPEGKAEETVYYVIVHSPGDAWKPGVDFREQPGVMDHVQYMAQFLEKGTLVMGGPFLDNSGGMMVLQAPSREAAEQIAYNDPTVKNGLLKATVKPWFVAMSKSDR